ncbi:MAG TPA: TerC/Alx family metal homeostasis membrane protein [Acidobacteriaceae bacterium]|jgi:tellurite resistance protein TerC|nr:TerC/Alx family metal homeostasis membrane protein [Acidobacteriaceae bacterium]
MHSTPLSYWIGFHVVLIVLLAAELIYARRRARLKLSQHHTEVVITILWVGVAFLLAGFVYFTLGHGSAVEYIASYALEESLSIDNLFVFLLLFRAFHIEPARQPKVLFWGVAGAIVMRGAFIAGGLSLLARFEWVTYIFAAILLFAAVRLLSPGEHSNADSTKEPRWISFLKRYHPISLRQDAFFVRENGTRMATILMLALVAIEITDVIFALDSIPAVLSITRHPFLAYSSNIMAVMGLRSLYFLLIGMLARLRYLHYGLAVVLAFAAVKMLGSHWIAVGPLTSLTVILIVLAITIATSMYARRPNPA